MGTVDAARLAVGHLKKLGNTVRRIGVETSFIPADAYAALREGLPGVEIVDALFPLERLRAVKTPAELDYLRTASERVIDSMLAVFASAWPGKTKKELADQLQAGGDLPRPHFDYCLITAGTSLNRAPSDQVQKPGDVLSLDSGGNYKGYIGDLFRVGILGEPDAELRDLLAAAGGPAGGAQSDQAGRHRQRDLRRRREGLACLAAPRRHRRFHGAPHGHRRP